MAKTQLNQTGKLLRVLSAGALAAGAYVGLAMPQTSIGVDGTSLDDLAAAHPVDCGAALNQQFSSVNCTQALSGRKTTSLVLLIGGGIVLIGSGQMKEQNGPPAPPQRPAPPA